MINTGHNLSKLSTTGGAGGIIDIFYEPWRLKLATHPQIFSIIKQLWSKTYAMYNPQTTATAISVVDGLINYIDTNGMDNALYRHPFGSFDAANSGYLYMNRVCFRVSDKIAAIHSKKKRKLQRCLAPHLDCCPHDMFGHRRDDLNISAMQRWRPIQCFVALTDNHFENTGGFECVRGFHRKFAKYFGRKTSACRMDKDLKDTVCVGDFCRLLPKEDKEILDKYEHIEYDKGSLVLFDWRIPHANARFNRSDQTRMVVYTGFLPNIELNAKYCQQQLQCYYDKKAPPDFWGKDNYTNKRENVLEKQMDETYEFTELGQKLMGIRPWKE